MEYFEKAKPFFHEKSNQRAVSIFLCDQLKLYLFPITTLSMFLFYRRYRIKKNNSVLKSFFKSFLWNVPILIAFLGIEYAKAAVYEEFLSEILKTKDPATIEEYLKFKFEYEKYIVKNQTI